MRRNREARAQIANWLSTKAQKHYLALVAGTPQNDSGAFTSQLYDDRRKRPLNCETRFEVRQRYDGFSLLELILITGRKHQIRRHLSAANLPIVGDTRYGPKRPKRVPAFPGRLWLHASQLVLPTRSIKAPLPADLRAHLDRLATPNASP